MNSLFNHLYCFGKKDHHLMHNGSNVLKNIYKNVPKNKFKILSVSRDYIGYLLTNYLRFSSKVSKFNSLFKLKYYLSFNNIKKHHEYNILEKKFSKKNILMINFDDFFINLQYLMHNISKFLKIKYSNHLLFPTLDNNKLVNDFTGKMIDNPKESLSIVFIVFLKNYYKIFKILITR